MTPSRFERVRSLLRGHGCEALLAVGPEHVVHLAGYDRYLGGPAAVVLLPDGERVLVVARFEHEVALARAHADRVVAYGPDDLLEFGLDRLLLDACRPLVGSARLAVAADAACSDLAAVDVGEGLAALRRVKDADELARVATSYEAALAAQAAIAAAAAQGASEIELYSLGRAAAERRVGAPVGYVATVASGTGSAQICPPMHVAGAAQVGPDDVLLADIAVRYDGYWGDSTRTTVPADQPEAEATRAALETIKDEAARHLLPGRTASDVFEDVRASIMAALPGCDLVHHAGHGIGISLGEDPQLIPSEHRVLEAGMVLALEPGVYHPGRFGVRVEDLYVVTPSGGERLRGGRAG